MSASHLLQNEFYSPSQTDPDNRDPMKINKHLQLDFFNVIAEPDASAYSFDIFHKVSHQVYHYTKIFIYRLLTIILGLPLMVFWGLLFGIYTFAMIWIAVPIRRLIQTYIGEVGVNVQTISDAIIAPIHRSMGQIFSNIRVSLVKENIYSNKQILV